MAAKQRSSVTLQELSQTLGLENSVTFTGRVDHNDLPHYYSAADLLVLPSHTESFGLVGLEALACGTPVLSTRVGAMDRIISSGKTGLLVPAADPLSLCRGHRTVSCRSYAPGSCHARLSAPASSI